MKSGLVELVAQAIYERGTETPDEFKEITGYDKRLWKTDAPWDTNPNELAEHERDDYRRMAKAALDALFDCEWPSTGGTSEQLLRSRLQNAFTEDPPVTVTLSGETVGIARYLTLILEDDAAIKEIVTDALHRWARIKALEVIDTEALTRKDKQHKHVTEYCIGDEDRELCLRLQFKGKGWGVYFGHGSGALSVDNLTFDWEPMPSSRDEDFFREYRFATPEEGLATGIKAIGKMLEPNALNVTLLLAPVEKVVLFIDALNSAAEDFGVSPFEISASQIIEHKKSFLEKMEKQKAQHAR